MNKKGWYLILRALTRFSHLPSHFGIGVQVTFKSIAFPLASRFALAWESGFWILCVDEGHAVPMRPQGTVSFSPHHSPQMVQMIGLTALAAKAIAPHGNQSRDVMDSAHAQTTLVSKCIFVQLGDKWRCPALKALKSREHRNTKAQNRGWNEMVK